MWKNNHSKTYFELHNLKFWLILLVSMWPTWRQRSVIGLNRAQTTRPGCLWIHIKIIYNLNLDIFFSFFSFSRQIKSFIVKEVSSVEVGNLQALTQVTSVIARATLEPEQVTVDTQVGTCGNTSRSRVFCCYYLDYFPLLLLRKLVPFWSVPKPLF